jgi:hypothetical protein
MSITSASRLAILATLAAIVGAALVGLQGRAQAEEPVAPINAAPDLTWGFKKTWRNYAGEPQVSDGAAIVPPAPGTQFNLRWAFESGSYDPNTRTTQVNYKGSAHWTMYKASQLGYAPPPGYGGEPDPYILDVNLSDPRITISKDSSVLSVVATSRDRDTWELVSYGRIPLVNLDVIGVTPTVAGGSTEWSGIVATVAEQGKVAMADNYQVGQVVDPLSFSYTGPGGAPDFSEHWDQPGTATLELVQNALFLDNPTAVNLQNLWVDRQNMIVHAYFDQTVDGVAGRRFIAFSLEQMRQVATIHLPMAEAPDLNSAATFDPATQRLFYPGAGEEGMRHWLRLNLADEKYETGQLGDPQTADGAFFEIENPKLAWDPTRNRGYRIARVVPDGVSETDYDNHEWRLLTFAEGAGGIWVRKSFELPSFPAEQNEEGYAAGSFKMPTYATASDGSLIVLATMRWELDETATIPGAYRITFDAAGENAIVQPIPGAEVLNNIEAGGTFRAVQTSANGHFLLIRAPGSENVVHCQVEAGAVGCDPPVAVRGNVEAPPYDESRFAIDPADGTFWFGGLTSQKLAAFRDGAFAGGQFFKERNPKGGPVLVGDDHYVYAQTNDGSPGQSFGSKTWGFGKFKRLGFVPAVTAQPQPDAVSLAAGEVSEQASFSSTANGDPAPQRQWQVKVPGSNKFVDLPGETGLTLSVAATRRDDDSEYRAVYSNAAGKVATDPAALSVEYAPLVLESPANVKLLEGGDAEFAVLADGNPEPAVTWQREVNGFWENVSDEDERIVVEGNSLTVLGATPAQSGALFRARLASPLGTVNSEPAKLTVTPRVTIPPGGVEIAKATLEWSGSAELQKAPPFGGSNYFSAGISHGSEASFKGHEGNAFVFQIAPGGPEAVATWATRANHVGSGGSQQVRLYQGSGRVEADGSALVEWDGSYSVNFYGGLAPFTLTDPVLTVDDAGDGELTADLVGCASSKANPAVCTPLPPASDVTVATFSGVEVDPAGELTVTPDYAGVEVEVPSGTPEQNRTVAGWGAWPQSFVDYQVQTGLAAYWYSSGGTADPDKRPAPFTVDFAGGDPPLVEPLTPGGGAKPPVPPAPAAPVPPSVSAAKGVQAVGPKRRAKVATLRCPGASPCKVKAPRNAPVRIGGRTYWAEVFAPATIPGGGSATVRARLGAAALTALGEGRATLRVQLQVRSDEGLAKLLARVPIEAAG